MKDPKKVKAGKNSRKRGNDFEKRVRKDLEEKGLVVDKWTNNIKFPKIGEHSLADNSELINGELVPVKPMWINGRMLMNSGGFPDFIAFEKDDIKCALIGVESKMDGKLDKEEIQKARWLIKEEVFTDILIAFKVLEGRKITVQYKDFEETYGK